MKHLYQPLTYIITVLLVVLQLQAFAENAGGTISGTVTTSDGSPAQFVTIFVKEANRATVTSETGYYQLKGIKAGTYTLRISFTGLQTQEKTITVIAGKNLQTDFQLVENANKLAEVQIKANRSANQKVVSLGKGGISAKDMPQASQIISSEVINDQQANRLADVIKNVNGVAIGENRGSVNESFFARGYSLGTNNVLKNGSRSSTGGSPEASTLESVEVLKGSAALLYGGVTGGAVVNLVTKKPKFNYGGEVSLRAGSYGFYKPIVDVYGPISKSIAFRVIATKENANSYRDYVKTDRFYVNPSLLFKISPKTELIVQGDYLKSNYTPDFGIGTVANKIVDIGRNAFVNATWAYNNTNTITAQANLTHKFNENWKLNALVAYQNYTRDYFSAERPFAPLADGVAARNLTRSKSKEYTNNQQINLTGSVNTGAIKHTLLVGLDADQSQTTSNTFLINNSSATYNYGNVTLTDPSTYVTRTDIPDTRIISNTFTPVYRMGGFAQDLISVTEKFKVLAGIRYTYQKQPQAGLYNEDTKVTTSSATVGTDAKAFSPKFGLIYQPIKSTSLYVSYANNFTTNTGTDVNLVPLGPSIIDQYEAGIKNDFWDGKLSLNVTAYTIANNRFAQTALYKGDGTPNADATIKEFSGSTKSDGLEIDVTGKISKNLYFLGGYSYNYYRYTKTLATGITEGERIVGSIGNTGNGTLFYTFYKGNLKGLKLGASAYYTGDRNSGYNSVKSGTARGPIIPVAAFTTYDLSAGYAFKQWSLLGKVSNITNEISYLVHENYSVNPIPPRMVSATLAYKFGK
ncbi:TonB-dependent receptor [Mucilaginibacter sp. HMF5004]|uniref:TonB-dependent receptor n=1 Tax=Mucilaginibacter rivuli TaxID=2857527 RepID=UPI001C5D7BB5|nr:TonB-dependent receptor [Mucilaginibacter rivuli]MBW4888764.1 TonB-dependent receptor [Mucilaginibacter rivuli]